MTHEELATLNALASKERQLKQLLYEADNHIQYVDSAKAAGESGHILLGHIDAYFIDLAAYRERIALELQEASLILNKTTVVF